MAAKIPVGVNIIASEQVTKVFDKVRASIQKVFSTVNEGPKNAASALQASEKAVETTQAAIDPGNGKKPWNKSWNNKDKNPEMSINGGGFGSFQKPAQTWASGVEGMSTILKNFILLLVGSGGVTYGIKRFSDHVSDSVINMNRLGDRVGMPTRDIRELGFVARAAGVPVSALSQALTNLSDTQFDKKFAIQSESVKAFSALNSHVSHPISLLNSDGTRADLKKVFLDTIQGLSEVNDPSLKARLSSLLLGGEESLKFSDMGATRLKALTEHFKVSPFSQELTGEAYHYNQAIADIDASLDKLKFTAGTDILKGFSQGLEKSADLISKNSGNIQKLSSDLAERLPKALPAAFSGLNSLAGALEKVDKTLGLLNVAMGILGTYTVSKLIIMMGELTKAFTIFRAASLFTNPITGVVAGTALAVGIPYALSSGVGALAKKLGVGLPQNEPMISASAWKTGLIPQDTPAQVTKTKPQSEESLVRIIFENAPTGMRVIEKNASHANIAVELGLNLGGAF